MVRESVNETAICQYVVAISCSASEYMRSADIIFAIEMQRTPT